MNATALLEAMNIRAPELTGTVRIHRMDAQEEKPDVTPEEQKRIRAIENKIFLSGEKRDKSGIRNQSREIRHRLIIEFISGLQWQNAADTHELADKLSLYYTTLVNDLIDIRRSGKINFSTPTHSGIGRKYWGLGK